MAVSKRLRYEVLRRDDNTCRYCGASAPDVPLRVDHVMPVALGGTDDPTNLVTACEPCNSGKTSTTPGAALVAGVSDDALRWAEAMKRAAEALKAKTAPKLAYRAHFKQSWDEWTWEQNGKKKTFDLDDGWKTSLDNFREAGLPEDVWPDIVEKAMTNKLVRSDNTFRYCCGIAWRMVGELQEVARSIVGAEKAQGSARVGDVLDIVGEAAVEVWARAWLSEQEEAAPDDLRSEFRRSVVALQATDRVPLPDRLMAAARHGAIYQRAAIDAALAALAEEERANVVMEWADAWRTTCGEYPPADLYSHVMGQVNEFSSPDYVPDRVARAAVLAGSNLSVRLHRGLLDEELAKSRVIRFHERARDIWLEAYTASGDRWPTPDEQIALYACLGEIDRDGNYQFRDVYAAAAAAGAYQDPDLTTCLSRNHSVFEAAATPMATR